MSPAMVLDGPKHDSGLKNHAFNQGARERHFRGRAFNIILVRKARVMMKVRQPIGMTGAKRQELDDCQ